LALIAILRTLIGAALALAVLWWLLALVWSVQR